MKWIEKFYDLQYEIIGNEDLNLNDESKLDILEIPPPAKIIELGSGRGEFAIVAAKAGYSVTAIEIVKKVCDEARELAAEHSLENIEFENIDFYEFNSSKKFDILCYWDGFGLGEDIHQIQLLKKFKHYLKTESFIYIEVYSSLYWSRINSNVMNFGDGSYRSYSYDHQNNRLLDYWWKGDRSSALHQSLRCYSPNDFESLIKKSGYKLLKFIPTGYVDYKLKKYITTDCINKCMSYIAVMKIDVDV